MPKVDWVWLIVGIVIGGILHVSFTHEKSPLSGAFSFYYGSSAQ